MGQNQTAQIAITIQFKAISGKETELAKLLAGAAELVKKTEPKTLYWFATQIDQNTFTINDGFADESGLQAHFGGVVAKALKDNAEALIVGGWENGVLPNVQRKPILSSIQ